MNLRKKPQLSQLTSPTDEAAEKQSRSKAAQARRQAHQGTMAEAWERVFAMKNAEADLRKLREVKAAMDAGELGREDSDTPRRFSKAEALRLHAKLEERKKEDRIKSLIASTPENYTLVNSAKKLRNLREMVESSDLIAVDCETFGENPGDQFDPWLGEMAGFSVSNRDQHYYVPLNHAKGRQLASDEVFAELKTPMESTPNVMHNGPFDAKFFYVQYGVNLIDSIHADTQVMAMALNENVSHRLKDLCESWLGIKESWTYDQLFAQLHRFNEVPLDAALVYAAGDTDKTFKVYDWMLPHFDRREDLREIKKLVFETEHEVVKPFIWADIRGMNFDKERAAELDDEYAKEESRLEGEIHELLGEEINIGSPAQLKQKLFADLKLPDIGKGSTATKVLQKITSKHEVIPEILEYRQVNQLRKAFTKTLPQKVKEDGRVHPSHNTWGAKTGRFTCKDPNTQQMPAKRPEVRKLFTASKDRIFASIDYSQIELRVLAHLAQDPVLIDAFLHGKDIHSTTGAQISGIPYEQIQARKDDEGTAEQKARKNAKPVNFGITYGLTKYGLANQLNITEKEAQVIIDAYFASYAGISGYMDAQKRMALKYGYVTDMFGRKRRLREQLTKGYKNGALRQAGNFPIQSSAGTILKKAVVDLLPILPKMGVHIVMQCHDELVFDCPKSISQDSLHTIQHTMENTVQMDVPVKCDLEIYPERWMGMVDEKEWFVEV